MDLSFSRQLQLKLVIDAGCCCCFLPFGQLGCRVFGWLARSISSCFNLLFRRGRGRPTPVHGTFRHLDGRRPRARHVDAGRGRIDSRCARPQEARLDRVPLPKSNRAEHRARRAAHDGSDGTAAVALPCWGRRRIWQWACCRASDVRAGSSRFFPVRRAIARSHGRGSCALCGW